MTGLAEVLAEHAPRAVANRIPLGFTERDPYANVHEAAAHILAALAELAKGRAS